MTRRLHLAVGITVAVLIAALTALAVSPAAIAVPSRDRYALGDSVMLGARTALKAKGFAVNATVSRQAYSAPALVRKKRSTLPQNLVVHLGTNGTFPLSTCKSLVRAAGPDRRVFLVTVHARRSWTKSNNAMMRTCAAAFRDDRVQIVDWNKAASSHPSWMYSDGIHLRPSGRTGYARLLDSSVDEAIAEARIQAIAEATGSGKATVVG